MDDSTISNLNANAATFEDLQQRWLKQCLPIIVQPRVDAVENGNGLIRVFYEFYASDPQTQTQTQTQTHTTHCRMSVVYGGESSYACRNPSQVNMVATWFYRSFNRLVYGRTADVDYLEFRDVRLSSRRNDDDDDVDDDGRLWGSLFTTDYAGPQTWSRGDGFRCFFPWFTLMVHYRAELPFQSLTMSRTTMTTTMTATTTTTTRTTTMTTAQRPVLFLNTSNHLWGEVDRNPDLTPKHVWKDYPIEQGGPKDATEFARRHVPHKPNLLWCCPCCRLT